MKTISKFSIVSFSIIGLILCAFSPSILDIIDTYNTSLIIEDDANTMGEVSTFSIMDCAELNHKISTYDFYNFEDIKIAKMWYNQRCQNS